MKFDVGCLLRAVHLNGRDFGQIALGVDEINVFKFKTVTVVEKTVERGGVICDFVALVRQIRSGSLSDALENFVVRVFGHGVSDVWTDNVLDEVSTGEGLENYFSKRIVVHIGGLIPFFGYSLELRFFVLEQFR